MRPSYDLLLAIAESNPDIREAERMAGVTAPQWAASFMRKLDGIADPRQRDAYFASRMEMLGVFTSGIEAFNRGTDAMLERLERRDTFHDEAQRLSEQSRNSPHYVDPRRVEYIATRMQRARLTQGLNDRLRERDAQAVKNESPLLPPNERVRAQADDSRDRRSALAAAFASNGADDHVRLRDEHASLRDSISASFDAHEYLAEQDVPLLDEELRSMSNAV